MVVESGFEGSLVLDFCSGVQRNRVSKSQEKMMGRRGFVDKSKCGV